MKINKQLFEDVLSGKLRGRFVFRNGDTYFSAELHRNYNKFNFTHPYVISFGSYTPEGIFSIDDATSGFDIIDFIPDTDTIEIDPEMYSYNEKDIQFIEHFINGNHMKENELTIEIPDGKIIDWDESKKQNKIVLKDKQLTYEDVCKKLFNNGYYYTDCSGFIDSCKIGICFTPNSASTKHQLECILAKNKLANVAKYLNGEWKPDASYNIAMMIVDRSDNIVVISVMNGSIASNCGSIWFKTEDFAQQAIEILGEETVKLALEPLGI